MVFGFNACGTTCGPCFEPGGRRGRPGVEMYKAILRFLHALYRLYVQVEQTSPESCTLSKPCSCDRAAGIFSAEGMNAVGRGNKLRL